MATKVECCTFPNNSLARVRALQLYFSRAALTVVGVSPGVFCQLILSVLWQTSTPKWRVEHACPVGHKWTRVLRFPLGWATANLQQGPSIPSFMGAQNHAVGGAVSAVDATCGAAAVTSVVAAATSFVGISAAVRNFLVATAFLAATLRLLVMAAFLPAALSFRVLAAFLPAALSFRVRAAFVAAKLFFVGMGVPFESFFVGCGPGGVPGRGSYNP